MSKINHNNQNILSKVLLYSTSANCFFLIVTVFPLLSKKIDSQKDLDNCMCALRQYIILMSIWMMILMYFMYKNYKLKGLIYSLAINILLVLWVVYAYLKNFKNVAKTLNLNASYRNQNIEPYVPIQEWNHESDIQYNPPQIEQPGCSLNGNQLCH